MRLPPSFSLPTALFLSLALAFSAGAAVAAGLSGEADPVDRPVPARRRNRHRRAHDREQALRSVRWTLVVENKPGAGGQSGR